MKFSARKRLLVLLLVAAYIVCGFFREFVFLNINEQRRVTYNLVYRHIADENHVAPSMQWLSRFSYEFLNGLKWPLTLFFAAVFAFIASRVIRIAFGEKKLARLTWIAYGIVFLAGILFYLAGWALGDTENTYTVARFFAGLTETPALLAILFAAFLFLEKQKENKTGEAS